MRTGFKRKSRGYSLVEMLVVLAIIGILSLISVPAFMNYKRSGDFKSAMRAFTTDLRNARAAAISNSFDVRVEIANVGTANSTKNRYYFYSSQDNGVTWTELTLPGSSKDPAKPAAPPYMKEISSTAVWVDATTNLPDYGVTNTSQTTLIPNSMPDVVFHPNGTATLTTTPASVASGTMPVSGNGTVVLRTNWKKIAFDTYTITLSPSGQFTVTGTHS